jgi:hypothetical protein
MNKLLSQTAELRGANTTPTSPEHQATDAGKTMNTSSLLTLLQSASLFPHHQTLGNNVSEVP